MIPVIKQDEPANFDKDVRQPGKRFLAVHPNPKSRDFKSLWNQVSADMYRLYNGICAYTGEWFSTTQTAVSIDHFIPKSFAPHLAYEWDNYRLTIQKINGYKADKTGLIDPFEVQIGWFVLDIPSCIIKPNDSLPNSEHAKVQYTIEVLKLNDDDAFVQRRCDIIMDYVRKDIAFNFMQRKYPYIACELQRQNLIDTVGQYFKPFF
jgi:hypothetical protein